MNVGLSTGDRGIALRAVEAAVTGAISVMTAEASIDATTVAASIDAMIAVDTVIKRTLATAGPNVLSLALDGATKTEVAADALAISVEVVEDAVEILTVAVADVAMISTTVEASIDAMIGVDPVIERNPGTEGASAPNSALNGEMKATEAIWGESATLAVAVVVVVVISAVAISAVADAVEGVGMTSTTVETSSDAMTAGASTTETAQDLESLALDGATTVGEAGEAAKVREIVISATDRLDVRLTGTSDDRRTILKVTVIVQIVRVSMIVETEGTPRRDSSALTTLDRAVLPATIAAPTTSKSGAPILPPTMKTIGDTLATSRPRASRVTHIFLFVNFSSLANDSRHPGRVHDGQSPTHAPRSSAPRRAHATMTAIARDVRAPRSRASSSSTAGSSSRPSTSAFQTKRHARVVRCRVADDVPSAYVPSAMDTSALAANGVVLVAVGAMVAYWWFGLVPDARVRLARDKKAGTLRKYLEELKEDDERGLERWFYSEWLRKVDPETKFLLREEAPVSENETDLERVTRLAKKTPKFWSLDNPVLVGTALTIGVAALTSGTAP